MAMHINVSDVTSFWEKHLSEDNRPSTDKERQVVRVKGVKIILLSDGEPGADGKEDVGEGQGE